MVSLNMKGDQKTGLKTGHYGTHRQRPGPLGEGLEEEGEHSVSGNVGEGC